MNLLGKEHSFHTTTFISGLLLVALGILFLANGNTGIINRLNIFNVKFYEEGLQRELLNSSYSWAIALLVFVAVAMIIWYTRRENGNEEV